ncbi:helix-turn-helix domain-containing protein [Acetobacterium malicum]|uniref:helix-turn-helix domain-containing protein n=1 Tax=Acetobacterium malicum TaxID=52692 RepID=UPI00047E053C|nr:helix-turn-helix transcriptional regulator [Acetobacterium dehalogenans]
MNISLILRKIRTTLGLSQTAFAKKIHVSFSTVNRWENDRARPNRLAVITVIDIARQYGVDESIISELENELRSSEEQVKE